MMPGNLTEGTLLDEISLLKNEIDRLEAERKRLQDERELATMPKPVENPDWTEVKKMCQEVISQLAKDGWYDEDLKHYIYESAMEAVFGKDVFTWMNKRGR